MYSGDNRGANAAAPDAAGPSSQAEEPLPESGPALEVIEYANGETIWLATLFNERSMPGD